MQLFIEDLSFEKSSTKNEIGLNKKLLGESTEKFLCIDCLAAFLDVSVEELFDKIEDFKASGCKLFE